MGLLLVAVSVTQTGCFIGYLAMAKGPPRYSYGLYIPRKNIHYFKDSIRVNMKLESWRENEIMKKALEKFSLKYQTDKSLDTSRDYGFLLLLTGDYTKAVQVFLDIEKRGLGNEMTAANLGTAYEMMGQHKNALYWVKTSFKRNSTYHNQGTEWLHVKILEAKIQLEKNPNWLDNNTIIGIPTETLVKKYKSGEPPMHRGLQVTDFMGNTHDYKSVVRALTYQIKEYTFYAKPPNAVLADLLHSYHLTMHTGGANKNIERFKRYLPKGHGMSARVQPLLDIAEEEKRRQAE